jgi:hypothetical protein
MTRRLAALVALVLTTAFVPVVIMLTQESASADIECRTGHHDHRAYRNCVFGSSRIGGSVVDGSSVWWDFPLGSAAGRIGGVNFQLADRSADHKCTVFKIRYITGPSGDHGERKIFKQCRGTKGQPINVDLNQGSADTSGGGGADSGGPFSVHQDGTYALYHCIGNGHTQCIMLWSQNVAASKP